MARTRRDLASSLEEDGWRGGVPIDDDEAVRLRDAWRERYGVALKQAEGVWAHGGYEWHAFNYIPCLEREAAVAAYGKRSGSVVVLTGQADDAPEAVRYDAPPPAAVYAALRRVLPPDLLVFPESLEWTFAVTHEWGWYGPYFAPPDAPEASPRP
jgi:hypothetical protein